MVGKASMRAYQMLSRGINWQGIGSFAVTPEEVYKGDTGDVEATAGSVVWPANSTKNIDRKTAKRVKIAITACVITSLFVFIILVYPPYIYSRIDACQWISLMD